MSVNKDAAGFEEETEMPRTLGAAEIVRNEILSDEDVSAIDYNSAFMQQALTESFEKTPDLWASWMKLHPEGTRSTLDAKAIEIALEGNTSLQKARAIVMAEQYVIELTDEQRERLTAKRTATSAFRPMQLPTSKKKKR